MIRHPKPGQPVAADFMPYNGRRGIVRIVSAGKGPRNVGVEIDGRIIVIPRGNLKAGDPAA